MSTIITFAGKKMQIFNMLKVRVWKLYKSNANNQSVRIVGRENLSATLFRLRNVNGCDFSRISNGKVKKKVS